MAALVVAVLVAALVVAVLGQMRPLHLDFGAVSDQLEIQSDSSAIWEVGDCWSLSK